MALGSSRVFPCQRKSPPIRRRLPIPDQRMNLAIPTSSALRVHRLSREPNVIERQFSGGKFANQHRAGRAQPGNHRRININDAVFERRRSPGGGISFHREQVFDSIGNAVERPAILAGGNFLIGPARLFSARSSVMVTKHLSLGL